MCGINGFNFNDLKKIKLMNQSLKHRGPNHEGTYNDKSVTFGHRRLSIIDLSNDGNQPMKYSYKKNKAILIFNGEIYNYLGLKEELKKDGFKFNSNSDSEIILASYFKWGEDCVNHFNGMWAFCIYDVNKKILFLSRDRHGQKPLYYYNKNNQFIFSSEIKSILEHKIKKSINSDAIDLYFSLGFIPSPYSIYNEINKLGPGKNIVYDLKNKKLEIKNYFKKPKYSPLNDKSKLIKECKNLINDATRLRMISDVPLGAFLSGGIDSSTIVKNMSNNTDLKNLNTFSIGFEGSYDESKDIEVIKNLLKTKHHHKYFKESNFKEELENIFYYYDEPFSDPSIFPTFFLSEFSRKKITVSLSGDGGDEIFGGYSRHQKAAQIDFLKRLPRFLRKVLLILSSGNIKEGLRISLFQKYKIFSEARKEIYKPEIFKKISEEKMRECLKLSNNNLSEAVLLYDRYFNTMGDNYLCKVDRASMAYNLEVRSPFLDYRFIELSSKIPIKYKFSTKKNKILLREISNEFLPRSITKKKKAGFTPPIEKWILKDEYENEFKNILNKLFGKKLISSEWNNFYQEKIINSKDSVSQNYKIRLILYYYWAKKWKYI